MSYNAFKFNPWGTIPGRWLMHVFKKMVVNTVFWWHGLILKHYDKDAYQLDDIRLQNDKEMFKDFLKEWVEERLQSLFNAVLDMIFFILREDARYRRLYIILRNKLILEGRILALTSIEQDELIKWKGK